MRAPSETRVLVFTRTTGYRHESISAGVAAVQALGLQHGFAVEHSENAATFTDANLARFSVVMFLSTTGDILDAAQQSAFERFIRAGGGFVGVHSAADTEHDWPWYGQLIGAFFASHPAIQKATIRVEDTTHASTRCLSASLERTDEWYNYRAQPPQGTTLLVTLDESTYNGGSMGSPHPIAWYRQFDGGRAWYTGMGHTTESFAEPAYLEHLAGGIVWAATR